VVRGDARLNLERESAQQYDILVLDAFSSDSIPVHLLTREAFAIYLRHLRPDGVIAVHISNRYLDLEPVISRAAEHFGIPTTFIADSQSSDEDEEDLFDTHYHSDWMLLSRNSAFLRQPEIADAAKVTGHTSTGVQLWTDNQSDLFRILDLEKGSWLSVLRRWLL
jgi:hypothetical protein